MNLLLALTLLGRLALAQPAGVDAATSDAFQSSNVHEAAGRYREALADLDTVPAAARDTYVYHLRTGWLRYLAGDYEAAIAAYQQAVTREPKALEPRLGLLLPQMALHRWVDAEATAREARAVDPKAYLLVSRHAWILYNLGRYGEAEQAYREVLALYPSDVEMRAGLGWSLLKQGDKAGAAQAFRAALTVAPTYDVALKGLAAAE